MGGEEQVVRLIKKERRDGGPARASDEAEGRPTSAAVILSVVIVTYNSKKDLGACLATLREQDVALEIIVVDNCSGDGGVEWLQQTQPDVRVLKLSENFGFAAANNLGIAEARGEYVLVLNPDTEVHPGAIRELLRVAQAHPAAFINPKLLQPNGTVNACGLEMHYTGIPHCVGLGNKPEEYRGVLRPLLTIGTAVLARRDAWLDVGGFDERFFLYLEDMDLSLRATLQGYEMLCAADALVTHQYKLNMRPQKLYWLERNRLLTIFKTYESATLRQLAFPLLLTELATWAYAVLKGPTYLTARFSVYTWLWRHRKEWRNARSTVQAVRTVRDMDLLADMAEQFPYYQLVRQPWLARLLTLTTTPMYRRGQWMDSAMMPETLEVATAITATGVSAAEPAVALELASA